MANSTETPGTGMLVILKPVEKDLGGFSVRRFLPHASCRKVGPFVFFDHMGPAIFKSGNGIDVRPHPHIGLATITYLFEGEIIHRDDLGNVQAISPGGVNLMTAGRGIVHSERTGEATRAQGHTLHGLQVWIALPEQFEEVEPAFLHIASEDLPVVEINGVIIKIIIGTAWNKHSPVNTYSPYFYLDVDMPARTTLIVPENYPERALLIVSGNVDANGNNIKSFEMAICEESEKVEILANQDSRLIIFGGETMGNRHLWWNFVSSSKERIDAAKNDWKYGRFGKVTGDSEFIPLPEDS